MKHSFKVRLESVTVMCRLRAACTLLLICMWKPHTSIGNTKLARTNDGICGWLNSLIHT